MPAFACDSLQVQKIASDVLSPDETAQSLAGWRSQAQEEEEQLKQLKQLKSCFAMVTCIWP